MLYEVITKNRKKNTFTKGCLFFVARPSPVFIIFPIGNLVQTFNLTILFHQTGPENVADRKKADIDSIFFDEDVSYK